MRTGQRIVDRRHVRWRHDRLVIEAGFGHVERFLIHLFTKGVGERDLQIQRRHQAARQGQQSQYDDQDKVHRKADQPRRSGVHRHRQLISVIVLFGLVQVDLNARFGMRVHKGFWRPDRRKRSRRL